MRQYVCPDCAAVNRVPEARDPLAAKCGRCGTVLFSGEPADIDALTLNTHTSSTRGAAVLVDVWAPWCGPCRSMAPRFAAAAAALEPDVRLLKLNSEAHSNAAAALHVSGIPALLLFRDGKVLARTAGLMTTDQIVAWTRQALAGAPAQPF